jgi:cell division protein FtsL
MPNKIIITETDNNDEMLHEHKAQPQASRLTDSLKKMTDFDFRISPDWLKKQIPFLLFIVFLMLLHIWNVHYTERIIRNTEKLNRENKELRSEYISIFSELMNESKQSSIAKKLDTLSVKELVTPPVKITIHDK